MKYFLMPLMFQLKTTVLQFGYFFGLLFFLIFFIRGIREERLSDKLLGGVMFFMAMLIQDYTFGFAGINVLWEEMDGWPRHFPWLFPACVYFYFLTQTNIHFKWSARHLFHLLPYILYLVLSLILYCLGLTPNKGLYRSNLGIIWEYFHYLLSNGGIFYYFIKSLKIYKNYKIWAENQYSNFYQIELKWLRNFLAFYLLGAIIHLINTIIDQIFVLSFDQDYYWQLFTVITIVFVGVYGLSQKQEKQLTFVEETETGKDKPKFSIEEEGAFKTKIKQLMIDKQPYLNPELTLKELALMMNTNTTILSGMINQCFEKNFNDFINEYRVNAFKSALQEPSNKNLTLVAIGYDCGFNSKATFNRAVKKYTGKMPSEL